MSSVEMWSVESGVGRTVAFRFGVYFFNGKNIKNIKSKYFLKDVKNNESEISERFCFFVIISRLVWFFLSSWIFPLLLLWVFFLVFFCCLRFRSFLGFVCSFLAVTTKRSDVVRVA